MSTLEELPLSVEFAVSGMTCGACAARIQDQLNKIDGVDASVNYATETATVRTRFGIQTDELIQAVEEAGYGAACARPMRRWVQPKKNLQRTCRLCATGF